MPIIANYLQILRIILTRKIIKCFNVFLLYCFYEIDRPLWMHPCTPRCLFYGGGRPLKDEHGIIILYFDLSTALFILYHKNIKHTSFLLCGIVKTAS